MDATPTPGDTRGSQVDRNGRNSPGPLGPPGTSGPRRERGRGAGGEAVAYGALDLGTNNCRLLVASPSPNGFRVIDAFSRIVRLGEGLGIHGRLTEEAMERTIEALRVCVNKLKWHRVARQRLVATEACRLSANGSAFIQRVADETGLVLEIIDRETEAHLAAAGAEPLLAADAETAVVFDIGGGSTEVMWVKRNTRGVDVLAWVSMAAGVVTLSERHGGGRDVPPDRYAAMRADVAALLAPFVHQVHTMNDGAARPDHLLGTSGTVTTIAGVHLGLRNYDRSRVDGCWLEEADAERVTQELRSLSYEDRSRNGCIGRERADLVLAGCAIFDEIRSAFPRQRTRVADRGLREGILAQMMRADGHLGARS